MADPKGGGLGSYPPGLFLLVSMKDPNPPINEFLPSLPPRRIRTSIPAESILLEEDHLRLTSSQGSFPENSVFAVEATAWSHVSISCTRLVSEYYCAK